MNLEHQLFGNTLLSWLLALGVGTATLLVVTLLRRAAANRIAKIAQRTVTSIDNAFVAAIAATRLWLLGAVAFALGARTLALPDSLAHVLHLLAVAAFFVQIGLWAGRLFGFWLDRSEARARETNAGAATSLAALRFIGTFALWLFVLLMVLDNAGVNVTSLVAGLGIGGVAVAFALQNVLGDLFASLAIIIDKPFVVGDAIGVGDQAGTVERVGLKTTRLRGLGGEQIIFSNGDLLKAQIRNYRRMRERRIAFAFGVPADTDAAKLERIPALVGAAVEREPHARFERAHLLVFDDPLQFHVVFWMTTPEFVAGADALQRIHLALLRTLAAEGVALKFVPRGFAPPPSQAGTELAARSVYPG